MRKRLLLSKSRECIVCNNSEYLDVESFQHIACKDCSAGKEIKVKRQQVITIMMTTVVTVQAGQYSNSGDVCKDCTAGQYSSSGAGSCTDCTAGQYSASACSVLVPHQFVPLILP